MGALARTAQLLVAAAAATAPETGATAAVGGGGGPHSVPGECAVSAEAWALSARLLLAFPALGRVAPGTVGAWMRRGYFTFMPALFRCGTITGKAPSHASPSSCAVGAGLVQGSPPGSSRQHLPPVGQGPEAPAGQAQGGSIMAALVGAWMHVQHPAHACTPEGGCACSPLLSSPTLAFFCTHADAGPLPGSFPWGAGQASLPRGQQHCGVPGRCFRDP